MSKITFFLNMMGVYSSLWYEKNNIPFVWERMPNKFTESGWLERKVYKTQYCMGRVDIHGVANEPYGLEYGIEVMEAEIWSALQEYLLTLTLDVLPSKEGLLSGFEETTGYKIKWFNYENE